MPSFSRMEEKEHQEWPQILSPCSSRRSNDSNSPEFEFWMVRNPSCPQPDLHSADELFSHGILLPLHHLHTHRQQQPPSTHETNQPPPPPPTTTTTTTMTPLEEEEKEAEPPPGAERPEPGPGAATDLTNLSAASAFASSKRWKDIIFKRGDRKSSRNGEGVDENSKEKEKVKKKEKKKMSTVNITGGVGNGGMTAAELNINIWPFRSRSAGNGGNRPRMTASASATRKVSSAPCSRSNSAGESKSRKWPSSPSRGGVHLGRSSPVWQVRRGSGGGGATPTAAGVRSSEAGLKSAKKGVRKGENEARRKIAVQGGAAASGGGGGGGSGQRARILNLNVPMCIGYRHQLSCRSDENSAICVAASAAAGGGDGGDSGQRGVAASGEGVRGSNLFNIRGLFAKKVH